MGKRVELREEAKPTAVSEEEKRQLYASPPGFDGRYYLVNADERPIEREDFTTLKNKNWIWYWSSSDLEELDLFFENAGWRLDGNAVNYLANRGYVISIDTLEQQEERRKRREEERKRKEEEERKEREQKEAEFKRMIAEFEFQYGIAQLPFHPQGAVEKFKENDFFGDDFASVYIENSADTHEYVQYSLTPDGRVCRFFHVSDDYVQFLCSDVPAPEGFAKLIEEKTKEKLARAEQHRKEVEEYQKTTFLYEIRCKACGRTLYVKEDKMKQISAGQKKLCGKHRSKDIQQLLQWNAYFEPTGHRISLYDAIQQKAEVVY